MQKATESTVKYVDIISPNVKNFEGFLKSLTSLQNIILNVLYKNSAISVREIRNEIIMDTRTSIMGMAFSFNKEGRQSKFVKRGVKLSVEGSKYGIKVDVAQDETKEIYDEIDKEESKYSGDKIYPYELAEKVSKVLSKNKIPTPSSKTIEDALMDMLELGFVIRRKSKSRRIKALWFIHPKVYEILKEKED